MQLSHRPVSLMDIPILCGFPQSDDELFFLFPKAAYPLTHDQLKTAIDQRSDSTVVIADNRPAGFANFYQREWGGRCSIGNVMVAPDFRGCGVGRYLVTCMINIAFSRYQAEEIRISCFNQNVTGLLLYSALGFKPCEIEERKDHRGNRVALIHMTLNRKAWTG